MTCCTHDCNQGRDCPLRECTSQHADIAALLKDMDRNLAPHQDDEMSIAAVWILALIAGLMFVGLGFSIVWMIFGG